MKADIEGGHVKSGGYRIGSRTPLPRALRSNCRNCAALRVEGRVLRCAEGLPLLSKIDGDYRRKACLGFRRVHIEEGDVEARAARVAHLAAVDAALGRSVAAAPVASAPDHDAPPLAPRRMASDYRDGVLAAYRAGKTRPSAIVAATGFRKSTVVYHLRALREDGEIEITPSVVVSRTATRSRTMRADILALYRKGTTRPIDIMTMMGVSNSCVHSHLRALRDAGEIPPAAPRGVVQPYVVARPYMAGKYGSAILAAYRNGTTTPLAISKIVGCSRVQASSRLREFRARGMIE